MLVYIEQVRERTYMCTENNTENKEVKSKINKNGTVNNRKVAIIGCGFVGSASAFALMQSALFTEMVLLDANEEKAIGEAYDISQIKLSTSMQEQQIMFGKYKLHSHVILLT